MQLIPTILIQLDHSPSVSMDSVPARCAVWSANMSLRWLARSVYLPAECLSVTEEECVRAAMETFSGCLLAIKDRIMRGWVMRAFGSSQHLETSLQASAGKITHSRNSFIDAWDDTLTIHLNQAWVCLHFFKHKHRRCLLLSESDPSSRYNPQLQAYLVIRWLVSYNTKPNEL